MNIMINFKNKKVLIFGLGILGGGLEAAKWFYKKRAKIIITDLKTKKELSSSLNKLKNIKAKYVLGKHRFKDIDWADILYVNPAVSYKNNFIKYALERNKEVVNDCYLFFKYAKGDIIAITGTRGKTTTTTWIYQLLKICLKNKLLKKNSKILLGGNQPEKSLFKILDKTNERSISVLELSSFQLEFYQKDLKAPKIAIITCLLRDHLNRYESMEEYANMKAKIFINQNENDYLILNYDNKWTKYFLNFKPKGQIYFISLKKLPKQLNGIFVKKDNLYIRDKKEFKILNLTKFKEKYGEHNIINLLFAILAIYLYIRSEDSNLVAKFFKIIKKSIYKLETPQFRQEIIYKKKNLVIINDSASTTPDATIFAIKRFFKYGEIILITGGTDKNLDFINLSKEIKNKIKPSNLILLNGSATNKLISELEKINYRIKKENIFENLKDAIKQAIDLAREIRKSKSIILFSPASASFEKFKNEFDRGRKFNFYIKKYLSI